MAGAAQPTGARRAHDGHQRRRTGTDWLRATRGQDIPSNRVKVCVDADLAACPGAHGKRIIGSRRGRRDQGHARLGRDQGRRRRRPGRSHAGAARTGVNCGGGRDQVIVDARRHERPDRRELRAGRQAVTKRPGLAAAVALACAVAAAGCGFGAGPSSEGTATLTVTRDYGSTTLVDGGAERPTLVRDGDALPRPRGRDHDPLRRRLRAVDRRARRRRRARAGATTGSSTSTGSSRRSAPPSARPGRRPDLVGLPRLDRRDAGAGGGRVVARAVRAGLGRGRRQPVRVECLAGGGACETAADRLADAGVQAASSAAGGRGRAAPAALRSWSVPGATCAPTARSTGCAAARRPAACSRASRARSTAATT